MRDSASSPHQIRKVWRWNILLAATAVALATVSTCDFGQSQRHVGDVLATAIPLATLAAELWFGDREGAGLYGLAFGTAAAGAEAQKHLVRSARSDDSDNLSLPFGDAARAFSAAVYVRKRHGLEAALPLYAAALCVGHMRVSARRYR